LAALWGCAGAGRCGRSCASLAARRPGHGPGIGRDCAVWVGGVTQRANRMVQTDVFSKFKIKKLKNRKRKNKILKNSKYVIRYKYDYTDILFCFTPRILIIYVLS
jgi:hypothetical protein